MMGEIGIRIKSEMQKTAFYMLFFCLFLLASISQLPSAALAAEAIPEAPAFSAEPGFYEEPFLLELTQSEGAEIYYTIDSSFPLPGSASTMKYQEPISLTDMRSGSKTVMKGIVVRAVAISVGGTSSTCATATYFIGSGVTKAYKTAVISLVTDPANLYDADTGIFVHYEERGREWERPFHVEYFSADGKQEMSIHCGARIHGGASRSIEMKSLRLYARSEYDSQKSFVGNFFENGLVEAIDSTGKPITKFKRLLLRGGGNEASAWERTYFRDILTAWIMKDTGLDIQAAVPAVVFLNGSYYGIMNLRERQDGRYVEEHYSLPYEEVATYEFWYDEAGNLEFAADAETPELTAKAYDYFAEAYQFATTADLTDPANYEKVCSYFDIENYINYLCIEIYCNNTDWPGNNCKAWSYIGTPGTLPQSDGRIRWFLYDTEFGYGLYGHDASENALSAALSSTSTVWPNQKGSTLLFRSLLKNDSFRISFVNRMLDMMNEPLLPSSLSSVVSNMASRYAGLIRENKEAGNNFDSYDNNIEIVRKFLKERPSYMYQHLQSQFDLTQQYQLHIVFDSSMGSITVNSLSLNESSASVDEDGFHGLYYKDYPVTVTAAPKEGFQFTGYSGIVSTTDSSVVLSGNGTGDIIVLTAEFEKLPDVTKEADASLPEDASNTPAETEDSQNSPKDSSTRSLPVTVQIFLSFLLLCIILLLLYKHRKKRAAAH